MVGVDLTKKTAKRKAALEAITALKKETKKALQEASEELSIELQSIRPACTSPVSTAQPETSNSPSSIEDDHKERTEIVNKLRSCAETLKHETKTESPSMKRSLGYLSDHGNVEKTMQAPLKVAVIYLL